MDEVLDWLRHAPMTRAEYFAAKYPPVSADPQQGYWLDFRVSAGFAHIVGGVHSGDECPNCEKPLLRFLSLDTKDERLFLRNIPVPHLPLLFCWTCEIAQNDFVYRVEQGGTVKLIDYGLGPPAGDFPYEDYPDQFPEHRVDLQAIPERDQDIIRAVMRAMTTSETRGIRSAASHSYGSRCAMI